jgi:hypothetical protein
MDMRFAIAAMMTLFLIGTIFAQDASVASPDATQPAANDTTAASTPQPPQETATPAPDATLAPPPAPAPSSFTFRAGATLGSDVLLTGANATPENWTRFGFQPDFAFGKIGIGFDLTIHFMLYPNKDTAFKVYPGDWVWNYDGDGKSFLDVYLPKILYVRYGQKGEDPFFAKLGSVNDLSLGDGFIMSNYSNMHFLPAQRVFGLDLGVDGSLVKFPYVGFEALTGNVARFDVVGGRVYVRPLIDTTIPILKSMQVGATLVADTDPGLYDATLSAAPVAAYGADIAVPLVDGKEFPLTAFTDLAFDPNKSMGWMIGADGRLIRVFTYGAQFRILQDGFIPSYFDADYDIYRAQKYEFMQQSHSSSFSPSWYASLGMSLFDDILVFNVALDGPFKESVAIGEAALGTADQTDYPHFRAVLDLNRIDKIPFYFDATYEKYFIGAINGFFPDLVDPTDAVIGLNVNYKTGASVLTLAYNANWAPAANKFEVSSSLQVSVMF